MLHEPFVCLLTVPVYPAGWRRTSTYFCGFAKPIVSVEAAVTLSSIHVRYLWKVRHLSFLDTTVLNSSQFYPVLEEGFSFPMPCWSITFDHAIFCLPTHAFRSSSMISLSLLNYLVKAIVKIVNFFGTCQFRGVATEQGNVSTVCEGYSQLH